VLIGGISGAGRPLSRFTTAVAAILPMLLATVPDFGTGMPIVESPTT